MIDLATFHEAFEASQFPLDDEKRRVVDEPATTTLQVVAGPGTGKTTALVARILKLIGLQARDVVVDRAGRTQPYRSRELPHRRLEPVVDHMIHQRIEQLRLTGSQLGGSVVVGHDVLSSKVMPRVVGATVRVEGHAVAPVDEARPLPRLRGLLRVERGQDLP